jgi:hypothetical protein
MIEKAQKSAEVFFIPGLWFQVQALAGPPIPSSSSLLGTITVESRDATILSQSSDAITADTKAVGPFADQPTLISEYQRLEDEIVERGMCCGS